MNVRAKMSLPPLDDVRRYSKGGLAIVLALLVLILLLYFYKFNAQISDDHAVWGQFGDYVGGILNPILGFFSFVALLITLRMQAVQSETAVAAFARAQQDSARAEEEFHRTCALVQSIACALGEQSKAVNATAEVLALAHSLVMVSEELKEEQTLGGILAVERRNQLREQRTQLTTRLLQLAGQQSQTVR